MRHITDAVRPYKLLTVDDVPFGTFPAYPVGPATVLAAGYNVSITTNDQTPGAVSGAYKVTSMNPWKVERHELDGVEFPDSRAAKMAQYNAGLTAYMVYDDSRWAAQVTA